MSHQVPTSEPEEIRAGDTATWTKTLADYPPSDFTLYYALVNDGAQITITATDNGDGSHLVEVAASTTDDWTPGEYYVQGYVEGASSKRYTVYENYVTITPGLHLSDYASAGLETRSTVKQTLDALEAVIKGKASKDQLNYQIAGRSLSHYSPAELLAWRDRYAQLWRNEKAKLDAAAGRSTKRQVKIRLTKAS